MTVRNVGLDMATTLASRLSGYTLGSEVFAGPQRPATVNEGARVYCLATGGPAPIPLKGSNTANGDDQLRQHTVQVNVRSKQDDFQGGESLARNVRDALNLRPPSGYIELRCRESSANYLGKTDDGRHLWSLNFEAMTEETSS